MKQKMAARLGIKSRLHELAAHATLKDVQDRITALNHNPEVHGILLQLPLPSHLPANEILSFIDPKKDVDGLTPTSQGQLLSHLEGFVPCTPLGILKLMEFYKIPIRGQNILIVGKSALVGRPIALCLMHMGATITIAHRHTRLLAEHSHHADVIICAAGHPNLIRAEHLGRPCSLIDVGINRLENGKIVGDMDFEEILKNPFCQGITPVPGGIGKMTIQALMANTVLAAERFTDSDS